MDESAAQTRLPARADASLRADFARAEAAARVVAPVLRHLAGSGQSLFADAIVARVRGMATALAEQLPRGSGERGLDAALFEALLADEGLVAHLHGLALEWHLTERLRENLAIDPVVSPLLQALLASEDAETAGLAAKLVAAQARYCQSQRQMTHDLLELPADLFHTALLALRACAGPEADASVADAEARWRAAYAEGDSRIGLITRIIGKMGGGGVAALSVDHAGGAIFVSALARVSGQGRGDVILATNETQATRLAFALHVSGLRRDVAVQQFLAIHPYAPVPDFDGLAMLRGIMPPASGLDG